MTSSPASPGPAGFPAGPARWALLAGFAALTGIALVPLHPSPLAAALVAAGAITACALLVSGRSPRLLYGALAIAGITVLGSGQASQVGWFAVCLVGLWCGLAGPRRDAVIFLGAVLVLFITEWAWIDPDPGWAAWIAGSALSAVLGVLVRQQSELVTRLRQAQAGLADQARSEERSRIGRDLHDVIAHTLTVSLLHITSARLAVEHDPADAARALAEAERLSRESLEEVRLAVGLLHSGGNDGGHVPLPGADGLPGLIERFRSAGAQVSLAIEGDPARLHAATGLTVYRIAQEALTNAVRHAPGRAAAVALAIGPGRVRLTIDSAGPARAGSGHGLLSMSERAQAVGGTCSAGPGGTGWLVEAALPLTAVEGVS